MYYVHCSYYILLYPPGSPRQSLGRQDSDEVQREDVRTAQVSISIRYDDDQ